MIVDGAAPLVAEIARLYGGKFAAGTIDFIRTLNPVDPYNCTHPAEYVDGLSNTAAGIVTMAIHPTRIISSTIGSGWGSKPKLSTSAMIIKIYSKSQHWVVTTRTISEED